LGSRADFTGMIDSIEDSLRAVGEGAVHRDAAENLLYW
jgi:hypothetical protein